MRPMMRLAPCAVFLSVFAAAKTVVEKPTTGSKTGTPMSAADANVNSPGAPGGANASGLSLQGSLVPSVAPAPASGAQTPVGLNPIFQAPAAAPTIKAELNPQAGALPKASNASSVLGAAARGIEQGRKAEAAGGDGPAVRQELDRVYDLTLRPGDADRAAEVAGKISNGEVARFLQLGNSDTMDNAPGLYLAAISAAEKNMTAGASAEEIRKAKDDIQAVKWFAARRAGADALSEFVQNAYTAAAKGQTSEARRLAKSIEKLEKILDAPGRPLFSNAQQIKAGIESALAEAKGVAPRVWVVARDKSYFAILPGAKVEEVPGLAATFKLNPQTLSAASIAWGYRVFVAAPGARSALRARVALGESLPSAALGTGWLWLKYMVMRVWSALTALLPGRGLPAVANDATLPRLREAAQAWRDAVTLGDAAARAAGKPRLTVSRARGAFTLARRAAAAHEALTGQNGAVSRVDSLASEFDAGVKSAGLSPAGPLSAGLETIVSGEGGLRHWASRHAADARERGGRSFRKIRGPSSVVALDDGPAARVAAALAAESKGMSFTAFGDALEASGAGAYGAVELSADLRSTENGGTVALKTERGDEKLAAGLDRLGFLVTSDGRGLRATLDAQTVSADAEEMTELAADGVSLIMGTPLKPAAASSGLESLLSDMKRSPKTAAKTAASLDGRSLLSRARTVGWVGDDEAVEFLSRNVRVIALRDADTGLPKFARIESLPIR